MSAFERVMIEFERAEGPDYEKVKELVKQYGIWEVIQNAIWARRMELKVSYQMKYGQTTDWPNPPDGVGHGDCPLCEEDKSLRELAIEIRGAVQQRGFADGMASSDRRAMPATTRLWTDLLRVLA